MHMKKLLSLFGAKSKEPAKSPKLMFAVLAGASVIGRFSATQRY
jgi:hypothetical protein